MLPMILPAIFNDNPARVCNNNTSYSAIRLVDYDLDLQPGECFSDTTTTAGMTVKITRPHKIEKKPYEYGKKYPARTFTTGTTADITILVLRR